MSCYMYIYIVLYAYVTPLTIIHMNILKTHKCLFVAPFTTIHMHFRLMFAACCEHVSSSLGSLAVGGGGGLLAFEVEGSMGA